MEWLAFVRGDILTDSKRIVHTGIGACTAVSNVQLYCTVDNITYVATISMII